MTQTLRIFLLVQPNMLPIPDNITVLQNLGAAAVVDSENPELHYKGDTMLITAEDAAIVTWLGHLDGFWTCTSPMLGNWKVVHIKKELLT